ncbi:cap binding protein 80-PB [Pleurotus eryngii]|uniref:Cap binding protein 80-PB n=1 Tax=Pleurotus eryngii TaxID=5323 RepID=A0A9P6DI18_PLEER|nr:cap binding protein 80-PB [Pleurotus eryngii]
MSYNQNRPYRGGRRRNRDDWDNNRRDAVESPEQRLKSAILKFGEVDAVEELPGLVKQIHAESTVVLPSSISEAFRIGVTEQPYKIPYYVALLRSLYDPSDVEGPPGAPPLARQILEDFWKGFQAYLDKLSWRDTRLCIHFFAHLTVAGIISADSMFGLLQSFTAVLDEFGVSHGRAKQAALCAAEGLMIAGQVLKQTSSSKVTDIMTAIQTYNDTTMTSRWIVLPLVHLHSTESNFHNVDELLDSLFLALKALDDSDFTENNYTYPQSYASFPALDSAEHPQFDLPSVLVPPEVIELDGLTNDDGEDVQVQKQEWPEYYIRLFDDEISPSPKTPLGYATRSTIVDVVDIFEVNRKECARLLLELPKWTSPGVFKPRPGAPAAEDPTPGPNWQLESSIIEVILGSLLVLPESSHKSLYYFGLITELCKLSPPTVGPAVGKSIRKLYTNLAEGLDVDVARRFAEWFAVHMSNFGFQWVWKEWIPDLSLDLQHPRRTYMRRAIEFEIRLAYHERIHKTLPPEMQDPASLTISEQPPGPNFEYDEAGTSLHNDPLVLVSLMLIPYADHVHHDAAQSVLNLLRGRAKPDDVIAELETLKSSLETSDTEHVDSVVRSIVVQSLLHIGARSFSHLLNAIERYLPLLRHIASAGVSSTGGSGNAEAKTDILTAAATFWRQNGQLVGIVFDKLMQYQIVDPTDVITWTFANGGAVSDRNQHSSKYMSMYEWDLVKGALDKANGRVMIARRKVTALRKEDDETRARANARVGETMEVDADGKADELPISENPQLTAALKAFATLTREQKAALSCTLEGFVGALTNPDQRVQVQQVVSAAEWETRETWNSEQWSAWETWGWYRNFCRMYSPYLRNYSTTLYTISLSRFEGSSDPVEQLLHKTWNIAMGVE